MTRVEQRVLIRRIGEIAAKLELAPERAARAAKDHPESNPANVELGYLEESTRSAVDELRALVKFAEPKRRLA